MLGGTLLQTLGLAQELHFAGRLTEAERIYRQVLTVDPNNAQALHLLGGLSHQTGQPSAAIELISRAIAVGPATANMYNNLGEVYRVSGKIVEAVDCYQRSVAMCHGNPTAHSNLGNALCMLRELDAAADACNMAISLDPNHAGASTNLGIVRFRQGRLDEASACFDRAIAINSSIPEAHCGRGHVLHRLGRYHDAAGSFDEAVRLRPNYAEAHFGRAALLLLKGDYERGWAAYEWRVAFPEWEALHHDVSKPLWDGSDLAGRTILLHCEQGFGDTFQFVRYAQELIARGGRVLIRCRPELRSSLQNMRGIAGVIGFDEPLPAFDVHLLMLSLPWLLKTTLATVPAPIPYMAADPADVADWQAKLGPAEGRLRVGLAWTGNPLNWTNPSRSLSLSALAPLGAVPNLALYSLQKGFGSDEATHPPQGMSLIDRTAELIDFAQTAAFIECMDLVITVETAIAHLAGAMGKPVWTLLADPPDWRWLENRVDSPWYPTMRLFRQPSPGDWGPVVRMVADELRRWCDEQPLSFRGVENEDTARIHERRERVEALAQWSLGHPPPPCA
jgi:tetratricopeptide (TPR) repeat protein